MTSPTGKAIKQHGMNNDLNWRLRELSAAFNQLKTMKTNLSFYKWNVLSTVLYMCEAWHIKAP